MTQQALEKSWLDRNLTGNQVITQREIPTSNYECFPSNEQYIAYLFIFSTLISEIALHLQSSYLASTFSLIWTNNAVHVTMTCFHGLTICQSQPLDLVFSANQMLVENKMAAPMNCQ